MWHQKFGGGGCGDYLWKSVQLGSDSRVEFISLVSGFAIESGGSCGSWTQRYIGCDCRRVLKVVWFVFRLFEVDLRLGSLYLVDWTTGLIILK